MSLTAPHRVSSGMSMPHSAEDFPRHTPVTSTWPFSKGVARLCASLTASPCAVAVATGGVYGDSAYCGAPAVHPWSNAMATTSVRLFCLMFNAVAFSRQPVFEKNGISTCQSRGLAGAASERARVDELSAPRVIDLGGVEHPQGHRQHTHGGGARRVS